MDETSLEIVTAIQAVRMASRLCQRVREELVEADSLLKSDRSPVTIADFGSQAIVSRLLKEKFPDEIIVAEEDSLELRRPERSEMLEKVTHYVNQFIPGTSPGEVCSWIDLSTQQLRDRFWTLDPIDGTKGFLRGDQYAIALSLVENGRVTLGLMGCPNLPLKMNAPRFRKGCLFIGLKGRGSVEADLESGTKRVLSVSQLGNPSEAIVTESVESDHADHLCHERVTRHLSIMGSSIKLDSQAKYGIVARGEATLYLRVPSPSEPGYKEKIWDHAAGAIITEEAGGRVTDTLGRPLDFSSGVNMTGNHGVLVSNGILHDAVLKALRDVGCVSQSKDRSAV